MFIIPNEGELFPEFRFVFTICFPGEENYYTVVINLDEIEKIKSSGQWIVIDNHHFNKEKAEAFRFDTEIKLRDKWVSYTPEKAQEALKEELEKELRGSELHSGLFAGMSNDSIAPSSIEEALKVLMSNSNKEKTGR